MKSSGRNILLLILAAIKRSPTMVVITTVKTAIHIVNLVPCLLRYIVTI